LLRSSIGFLASAGRLFDAFGYTLATLAFFLLLISGGLLSVLGIIGLAVLAWLLLWRRRLCLRCKADRLIPIDTPRGLAIMKKHGWEVI
jgi:hypothetical protein